MSAQIPTPLLRIGELSRRTGVSADTLRAWERRYGLLEPERSGGGFRLYDAEDERRVRAMLELRDSGLSAAQAAGLAQRPASTVTPAVPPDLASIPSRLLAAFERFDEAEANRLFDEAIAGLSTEGLVSAVVLPVMGEIGSRWESGEVSVAGEHFATNVVRGRLLGLARNWSSGEGRVAVLACPPGELHDLGLICFGLLLRERGWRVAYLGPDTPLEMVAETVRSFAAQAAVIATLERGHIAGVAEEISSLAAQIPVYLGGAGVEPAAGKQMGAQVLDEDLASASAAL